MSETSPHETGRPAPGSSLPGTGSADDVVPYDVPVVRFPVDVAADAVVFDVVARGYARRQVDRHVAALEQELAELRWQQDALAAERQELAEQRAAQAAWRPSFAALGERVAELLRLADEEAAAVRAKADKELRRRVRLATTTVREQVAEHERALEQARSEGARELRRLAAAVESRRELLESELAMARRDGELEITGRLNQATAQARDLRAEAEREAEQIRATARAEVGHLERRRDELARDLTDLSAQLIAVVHRLDRRDAPLEVHTG